jgi:hypothetical protein
MEGSPAAAKGRRAPSCRRVPAGVGLQGRGATYRANDRTVDVFSAIAAAVTVEHPPSHIRAISTDENVTTDFEASIVVSALRIAGDQKRGLVGRALGVSGARLTHGGIR